MRSAVGDGVLLRRRHVIDGLLAIAYDRIGRLIDSRRGGTGWLGGFGCYFGGKHWKST
jgi:hypothetical protein